MIAIINYEMGNPASIHNMFKKIGVDSVITSRAEEILSAEKLVLPGVGAFDKAMLNLHRLELIGPMNRKVLEQKTPILGICLGMQLFSRCSEEGSSPGLGWIEAETIKFRFDSEHSSLRLPHMGWSMLAIRRPGILFRNMYEDARFYFVHSYHVCCRSDDDVLATTWYGMDFHSAIQRDNIMGTQFHPEKSHKFGLKLLEQFARA
jgi:imidazole glycerol-phosphate synthase subunit HisH